MGNQASTNSDVDSSKENGKKKQPEKEEKKVVMTPNSENRSNDEVFRVALDLPGVERSNIDVTFQDDFLTVVATRNPDRDGKPKRIYKKRLALVEDDVDMDRIDAALSDGVLSLRFPKRKSKPNRSDKSRSI